DRDVEPSRMQGGREGLVELQQGLAARADNEAAGAGPPRTPRPRPRPRPPGPGRRHRPCEGLARVESPAAGAVRTHEVRIAEAALCRGAILLASGPQIATGESQQHGG